VLTLDDRIVARVRAADYRDWRGKVTAINGCAAPIRLLGAWQLHDQYSGTVLAHHGGDIFVPCGNRRASVCPSCSDRYAADAYHLMHAGLAGGSKGVPVTVSQKPRGFATLTAPSFGAVHNRPEGPAARPGRAPAAASGTTPTTPVSVPRSTPSPTTTRGRSSGRPTPASSGTASPSACAACSPTPPDSPSASSPTTPGCPTPRSPNTSAAAWSTSTPSSASTAPRVRAMSPRTGSPPNSSSTASPPPPAR
jgi:hypothetical protein